VPKRGDRSFKPIISLQSIYFGAGLSADVGEGALWQISGFAVSQECKGSSRSSFPSGAEVKKTGAGLTDQ
jgi:hypothetical protein